MVDIAHTTTLIHTWITALHITTDYYKPEYRYKSVIKCYNLVLLSLPSIRMEVTLRSQRLGRWTGYLLFNLYNLSRPTTSLYTQNWMEMLTPIWNTIFKMFYGNFTYICHMIFKFIHCCLKFCNRTILFHNIKRLIRLTWI